MQGEDGLDEAGDPGGRAPEPAKEPPGLEGGHGLLDEGAARSLWWRRISWSKTHLPGASPVCQPNCLSSPTGWKELTDHPRTPERPRRGSRRGRCCLCLLLPGPQLLHDRPHHRPGHLHILRIAGQDLHQEAGVGPALPARHPVRPLQRHSLATSALGAGVQLGTDMLAPAGPVAEGRSLRPAAPGPARRTEREKKGTRHRSVAGRPAEDGQQTPPDLRRTRHPAQSHHDRGQRQRRHPDPRPGRRHPTRRGPPRQAPPTTRRPARRQGLRLQPQPRRAPPPTDPARHLPQGITQHRVTSSKRHGPAAAPAQQQAPCQRRTRRQGA